MAVDRTTATPPENQSDAHRDHVIRGMAAAMGAHFMFSIMVMLAKLLSENHSVIEIAFYRNLIASVPFFFAIFVLGRRGFLKLNTKPLLVGFRAVLGSVWVWVPGRPGAHQHGSAAIRCDLRHAFTRG